MLGTRLLLLGVVLSECSVLLSSGDANVAPSHVSPTVATEAPAVVEVAASRSEAAVEPPLANAADAVAAAHQQQQQQATAVQQPDPGDAPPATAAESAAAAAAASQQVDVAVAVATAADAGSAPPPTAESEVSSSAAVTKEGRESGGGHTADAAVADYVAATGSDGAGSTNNPAITVADAVGATDPADSVPAGSNGGQAPASSEKASPPGATADGGNGAAASPAFDEWKEHINEDEIVHAPLRLRRDDEYIINHASVDCGAQVMDANKDAKNIRAVLSPDKDAYLLNPCDAKAFLVIELCEAVMVHKIELANLELFSSMFLSVRVLVSDKYPVRDGGWTFLELFETEDSRQDQVMRLSEMVRDNSVKKTRGTEHYCPLSYVRVYGVTMVDEYNDMMQQQQQADNNAAAGLLNDDGSVTLVHGPSQKEQLAATDAANEGSVGLTGLISGALKAVFGLGDEVDAPDDEEEVTLDNGTMAIPPADSDAAAATTNSAAKGGNGSSTNPNGDGNGGSNGGSSGDASVVADVAHSTDAVVPGVEGSEGAGVAPADVNVAGGNAQTAPAEVDADSSARSLQPNMAPTEAVGASTSDAAAAVTGIEGEQPGDAPNAVGGAAGAGRPLVVNFNAADAADAATGATEASVASSVTADAPVPIDNTAGAAAAPATLLSNAPGVDDGAFKTAALKNGAKTNNGSAGLDSTASAALAAATRVVSTLLPKEGDAVPTAESIAVAPPGASGSTSAKLAKPAVDQATAADTATATATAIDHEAASPQADSSASLGSGSQTANELAGAEILSSKATVNPTAGEGEGAGSDGNTGTQWGAAAAANVDSNDPAGSNSTAAPDAAAPVASGGDASSNTNGAGSGNNGKRLEKARIPKTNKGAIVLAGAPGNDGSKKGSIFSQLSTKIKILERNMSLSERFLEQMRTRYAKINVTLSQEILVTRKELKRVGDLALNATNTSFAEQNLLLEAQQFVLLSLLEETSNIAHSVEKIQDNQSKRPLLGLFAADLRTSDFVLLMLLLSLPSLLTAIAVGICVGRMFRPTSRNGGVANNSGDGGCSGHDSRSPLRHSPSAPTSLLVRSQVPSITPGSRCARHSRLPWVGSRVGVGVDRSDGGSSTPQGVFSRGYNPTSSPIPCPSPIQLSEVGTTTPLFQNAVGTPHLLPNVSTMTSAPSESFGFYGSPHNRSRRDSI
eukprot:gene10583-14785_t